MPSIIIQPPFDILPSAANEAVAQPEWKERLTHTASRLITFALEEYASIRRLDERPAGDLPAAFDQNEAESIRRLYHNWVVQADELLRRIRTLGLRESLRVRFDQLTDAVGSTQAMLSVTLEDLERADEQFKCGQVSSLEEVRSELRARTPR